MDHFQYQNGRLYAEDVSLEEMAEAVGTPFYVYSMATLERHYQVFADALSGIDNLICYSVKANSNVAVLRTLSRMGAGADVVSGGELKRALAADIDPQKIVFSGVGKTESELRQALEAGILQINVESEPELESLSRIATEAGKEIDIALRINPDIDAGTHEKITTGKSENKFGIEWTRAHEVYAKAAGMTGINPVGMAVHIGSQLSDLVPFRDAYIRMRDIVAMLRADGYRVDRLDLGGGLGIPYGDAEGDLPQPAEYADVVRNVLGDIDCKLLFEPGRVIAGNAGLLVTRVVYVKEGATRSFIIVDAAMNDLTRPSLYGAYHDIVPVTEAAPDQTLTSVDVVGPICETGDTFCKARDLPPLKSGDLLALRTAGAYGAVMASSYNTRALTPEILVRDDVFHVIRKRLDVDALLDLESQPPWLSNAQTDMTKE